MDCNICSAALTEVAYEAEVSLTSLCATFPRPTCVRLCTNCGHLQTDSIENAAAFYDKDYSILSGSDEEDQIYEVRDGTKIYRTEHQIEVLASKLTLESGTRILDYGCAKSSVMRLLLEKNPEIEPHLYDITDRYVPFWTKFLVSSRWATYDIPSAWLGSFDIVTSFFALEHITRPVEVVSQVADLLKPGGIFYGIVPNVLTNSADLIVIDHVNHFTRSSLACLLSNAHFEVMSVDDDVHRGAFVFTARRSAVAGSTGWSRDAEAVAADSSELRALATFWTGAAQRLRHAERCLADNGEVAVYGAGFYGAFIKCSLEEPDRIRYFIDQNPYLQGRDLDGVPIIAPVDLPGDIHNIFVGLNPLNASRIIASVDAFATRDLSYFYI